MFILGIETSSDICSIGITSKENFLSELSAHTHNAHSESLFPGILNVINTAGMNMKDLSGVAVSSGPGSFTGLRIGVSAAKGIAFALNIPLFLIPTLDIFANYGLGLGKIICSIIPSIRGDVFYCYYKEKNGNVERISEYRLGKIEGMEKDFFKEGIFFTGIIGQELKSALKMIYSNDETYFSNEYVVPRGFLVAKMGYKKMILSQSDDIENSVPLYLREFDVKVKKF